MIRATGLPVLVACLAGSLSAQVSIKVVDADGQPIPAVRIDIWGRGELLAVASTSANGTVELVSEPWSAVRRLSLSHLGYEILIIQANAIPLDGLVRLQPNAIEIEGLAVEGRALCPVTDSPEARRVWSEVASSYSSDTGSRAVSARFFRQAGSIPELDLHRWPAPRSFDLVYGHGAGVMHGGDLSFRTLESRVATEGYAWPPLRIGGLGEEREAAWKYPELDRVHAYHFATRVFADLHDFEVVSERGDETTLAFCPNDTGNGATIRGLLTLVPGETFVRAEWAFETVEPDEGAGGTVSFLTYTDPSGSKPHLLATRGSFYRHSGGASPYPHLPRSYYRQVNAQSAWFVHPTSGHPCKPGAGFGYTIHFDPSDTPDGVAFVECVARYLGER